MSRSMVMLLVIAALAVRPVAASAQTDTTRRRDTTRTPTQDTARRVQNEARGEIDLGRASERFGVGRVNYGFSSQQALELQQALTRSGCDGGTADGVVGQRTLRAIQCFRDQQNLGSAETAGAASTAASTASRYDGPAASTATGQQLPTGCSCASRLGPARQCASGLCPARFAESRHHNEA